ncbi:hypothetical protein JCM6882_005648 [Rhodosporidiobolus microsporus]
MSTLDPAVALSLRLLRLSTSLAALVDPVEGARTALVQPLGDEVKRLMDEESALVTLEVNTLLSSAIDSLSSSFGTSPSLPYISLVTAVARVTAAAERLATTSVLPPPLARLPTELVARIVQFVQDEPDVLLRQRTNLSLSRSTRLLHTLVQPILAVEVAVGTPRQLEWLADKVERIGADALSFKRVSIDLHLDKIKRRKDGSWPGSLVFPMLGGLADRGKLDSLSVLFRSATPWSLDEERGYATNYGGEIKKALGLDDDDWWDICHSGPRASLPSIRSLDLPNLSSTFSPRGASQTLFAPGNTLRRLRVGCASPPSIFPPSAFHEDRRAYEHDVEHNIVTPGFRYEVLAVPFHTFYPRDFLPLVVTLPPPLIPTIPTITHLEVTFRVLDGERDLPVVAEILQAISPFLRRLALRIKHDITDTVEATVLPALESCKALEHVELGGNFVDGEALNSTGKLPKLRRLVLLSHADDDFDTWYFADSLPSRRGLSHVALTLCLPGAQASFERWTPPALRHFVECCYSGYDLRIEERPEEWAWMASDADM